MAADAKKRISLRNATTKYFNIKALSNGCYLLEPRVLVPPQALTPRVRKMLDQSVASLKKGLASPPIDLTPFLKGKGAMPFRVRMGMPEMEAYWNDLSGRKLQGRLDKHEEKFFKKLAKALGFLGQNPRHPGSGFA